MGNSTKVIGTASWVNRPLTTSYMQSATLFDTLFHLRVLQMISLDSPLQKIHISTELNQFYCSYCYFYQNKGHFLKINFFNMTHNLPSHLSIFVSPCTVCVTLSISCNRVVVSYGDRFLKNLTKIRFGRFSFVVQFSGISWKSGALICEIQPEKEMHFYCFLLF